MLYRSLANLTALFHGIVIVPILALGSIVLYILPNPPEWLLVSFSTVLFLALVSLLFFGKCFLTTWEQWLRVRASQPTYTGGFIRYYLGRVGVSTTDREVFVLSVAVFVFGISRLIFLWHRI